jgi:hypothetical protein
MSAFVIGVPVPEGLDSKVYRVRVVVDRVDGAALTGEDLARIEAVYPSKPSKAPRARAKAAKTSKTRRVRRGSARAA